MTYPGFSLARKIFERAQAKVPAYKKFLGKKISISSYEDFSENVPVMEKGNYLKKFDLRDTFPGKIIPPFAYASSGSSGQPTFWFRGDEQDLRGGLIHERIFTSIFRIHPKENVLVIICFSMGVWVAGNYTLAACREVARRGFNITTVTPGLEKQDIRSIFRTLAPHFDSVVVAGYPPSLMDVFLDLRAEKIVLPKKVYAITAGDKFSEEWRDAFMKVSGIRNHSDIVSVYGCADAGVLGHETPFSVFLRRQFLSHSDLRSFFAIDSEDLPALVQYDPRYIFFERDSEGDLLFTADTALPLVRYNLHDRGEIFTYQQIVKPLKAFGLWKEALRFGAEKWNLPFVLKRNRSDVAVLFYALNIYPEHIRGILSLPMLRKYVTGQFFAFSKSTRSHTRQELHLRIELKPGAVVPKQVQDGISLIARDYLRGVNIEYRKICDVIGDRAIPHISFLPDGILAKKKISSRGILSIAGKKPRVVGLS